MEKNINLEKQRFRKEALNSISKITNTIPKSKIIVDKLISEVDKYDVIALYASINNEVCLDELINYLLLNKKCVVLPRIEGSVIDFFKIDSLNDLTILDNKYKIREPNNKCLKIDKSKIGLVVCPGVAFDLANNRMGHGKGYYDKYLSDFHGVKIGVCFKEQLFNSIPHDINDIKMDLVICD